MEFEQKVLLYLILVGSLSLHEWAHAFVAHKLGDPTAHSQGRVTLNPIAHMDPIGTVLIPLFMIFMTPGFAIFGWGKPVPVNPRNFQKPARDDILTTIAGPASNLVICLGAVLVGAIAMRIIAVGEGFLTLLWMVLLLNSVLILFNLLPIPPLDGSRVMRHVVGMTEETYIAFARWGFVIILVLINVPAFMQTFRFLIGSSAEFFMRIMIFLGGA